MSSTAYSLAKPSPRADRLGYCLRVIRTAAAMEFKLKYAGSAVGYVWSLARPLAYFAVLWVVFERFLRIPGPAVENYPLYLLTGLVLYLFFIDAISMTMMSIVARGALLRRMALPPLLIPLSVSLTAALTFCVNAVAVVVLLAVHRVRPELDWLLLIPLVGELLAFILGIGLIASALYVRFRDVAQIWELASQLLIFATPIMYPVTLLPPRVQEVVFLSPLVQVIQDVRLLIVGLNAETETLAGVLGSDAWRLVPVSIALATLVVGLVYFRRDAPRLAERV
ncbi:MAG: ABC transporter permease [Actinobacteria bacterium]|nr:ABC transporter permease [Actinomycetota bacterium]